MNITNILLLFTILGHIKCEDFVKILKFLDKPECEHSGANLSIQQTRNHTANEITVCLYFKLKFLKPVDIINIGDGLQWIKITDFFQKVGFIAFNQMGKIFIWNHEVYLHVPVEWKYYTRHVKARGKTIMSRRRISLS